MSKESKHRRDERKKPQMTLKEKKHQKRQHKQEHLIERLPTELE